MRGVRSDRPRKVLTSAELTANSLQSRSDPAIEAVLAKLEPEDREVIDEALAQAEKTEAELRYLADHDSLTGLLDRRRFRAELDQYVSFTARYGGQGAVMIIDIDGLKEVNDRLGHQRRRQPDPPRRRDHARAGAGHRHRRPPLRRRVRGADAADRHRRRAAAGRGPARPGRRGRRRRRRASSRRRSASGSRCSAASAAIGAEAVLVAADQAMYRAKEEGRNRIALFQDPDEPQRQPRSAARRPARGSATRSPRTASASHTQPIRSLASGGIERYELLLRMTGENGELLPAASFIEAAERSGMVQELDRWVVGRRRWSCSAERERDGEPVSLHVNLSGASVDRPLGARIHRTPARRRRGRPGRCTFEITQTARVEDYEAAAGFADRLTEFGCEVAIDDYGAGFGPFHYLKQIPFDLIKIDGSFIRDMPHNDADQLTVQAIVQIARGLGKTTIAEFVQDEDTAQMLREYGVDMAQGYHLGQPGRPRPRRLVRVAQLRPA